MHLNEEVSIRFGSTALIYKHAIMHKVHNARFHGYRMRI